MPTVLLLLTLVGLGFAVWLLGPLWTVTGHLSNASSREPSRLYGRVTRIATGDRMSPRDLTSRLGELGYRRASAGATPSPGLFMESGDVFSAYLRSFPSPEGWTPPRRLGVLFRGTRIAGLEIDGARVEEAALPPSLLASYYGPGRTDRRPLRVDQVPRELVLAVLAAEDAGFFDHPGLSASAIVRAAWVNLRNKGIQQGGSTLTQQLVKNLFLSHDRTWRRKAQEVALALLVDLRYEKSQILQAYLNEIYLGAAGGVSLVGVGAAAWAYFGKDTSELSLSEAATLAGIIPAPATYSPLNAQEAARSRRDIVLRRLEKLGWVDKATIQAATEEPLEIRPQSPGMGKTPWFAAHAAREARAHHNVKEPGGWRLHTPLHR